MKKRVNRFFASSAIFGALFVLSLGVGNSAEPITHQISLPSGMSWCDDGMINGLFAQINTFRSQNGVAPLALSSLGMKAAEIRATQFATYMTTHTPATPGFNPHEGFDTTAASLGYSVINENLAFVTTDPGYIVWGVWQDSLHRAAMLTTAANVAGVSCVYYNGYPYWTYEPGTCSGASCGSTSAPAPPSVPSPPSPPSTPSAPAAPSAPDSEEWAFLTLINNFRAQNGLGALQVSEGLQAAARWMSSDLAAKNYFSHTDSLGRSAGTRLAALGYPYAPWGENIAAGNSSAQGSFNQWVNSSGHRANMLGAGFRVIGIARGYSSNSTYGWYWVTDFGGYVDQVITPPGQQPAPSITSFVATPPSIAAGQTATLSWNVSGATTITINQGVGNVSTVTSRAVMPSQTTTYTLTAANSSSTRTANVTVTVTAAVDTQPPTAPSLTAATATGSAAVALTWTASSDNVGVAGYQVMRNGVTLTSVPSSARSYADNSVSPASSYVYSIRAYDATGNYSALSNSRSVTTPAAQGATCPAPATGAFTGCYYNNITMSGNPVLTRTDSQINFDWGVASPAPSVNVDRFSVRWRGNFNFTAGDYTFSALTDDGMRVYVDGSLIVNSWRPQAPTLYKAQRVLTERQHLITVEYYENYGGAKANVSWTTTAPTTKPPVILSFGATPSATTAGVASMLSWSVNGATTIGINQGVGDVSGTTSKSVSPVQATTYTLSASNSAGTVTAQTTVTVTTGIDTQPPTIPVLSTVVVKSPTKVDLTWFASSDNVGVAGYQITRNGVLVNSPTGALAYSDTSASPNSSYTYVIRAYDAAGNYSLPSNGISATTPVAQSSGTCPAPAVEAFTGCYYNGVTLAGNPSLIRTDSQINFFWGAGSPDAGTTPANFSARWQGYFTFEEGNYIFASTISDGMRLYIDGRLVLDSWRDQPAALYGTQQAMTTGSHLIKVEYYARTGFAIAQLSWRKNLF